MRIHIDLDQCDGHGLCEGVDPDLFRLDDDGFAARSDIAAPEAARMTATDAAARCPMGAIRLVED
ncbi:N/A [soil metagenome]